MKGAVCTGLALHKEGRPGVVVAHRASLSSGFPREKPNQQDVGDLRDGKAVNIGSRCRHPADMILLMRKAASEFGNPSEMRLSVLPSGLPRDEVVREIVNQAKQLKAKGLISGVRVVRPRKSTLFRVDGIGGTVAHERLNREIVSRIFSGEPAEWEG